MAITYGTLTAKPQLTEGTHSLRLIQANHTRHNGRIELLFGSIELDGLASESVMPEQTNWVLPIWESKLGVTIDPNIEYETEEQMRDGIVETLKQAIGEYFDMEVVDSNLPPKDGKKLMNATFA